MTCENCGARRKASEAFCPHCGWHSGDPAKALVIAPSRALVRYKLDRAALIGGATTVGLSALWLAARWIAPRLAGALADRLSAHRVPARAAPPGPAHAVSVETVIWTRRIFIRRD